MKNLLKITAVAVIMVMAFSACVTTGAGGGSAEGGGSGAGAAGSRVGAVAEDGIMLLITGTSSAGWSPEFGVISMRDGLLTITGSRQGDSYWLNGRYRFPRRMDVSAFTQGYLKVDVMLTDIDMIEAREATIQLSSADFNYMKWIFNEIGSFDDGLPPQVPTEAGVWTTITLPLYANSWSDPFIENGLNHSRVDRFDIFMVGVPVEGSLHVRNIRVVPTP